MYSIAGIIIFFYVLGKMKKLTSIGKILPYLILAGLLQNDYLLALIGNEEIASLISSLLRAVTFASIVRIISLAFASKKEQDKEQDKAEKTPKKPVTKAPSKKTVSKPKTSHNFPDSIWDIFENRQEKAETTSAPPVKKTHLPYVYPDYSESNMSTAKKVVQQHLERRGYKVSEVKDSNFDLLAKNYDKTEFYISVLSFKREKDNNLVVIPAIIYEEGLKLGRRFLLYVVTDTESGSDSDYIGNYVTIYKMDTNLKELNFTRNGDKYQLPMSKFKKYAFDWETNTRY